MHTNRAAVVFNSFPDNCQTQARTCVFSRIVRLEHLGNVFGGDPLSGVDHVYSRSFTCFTPTVCPAKTWLTLIFRRCQQIRPHVVMTAVQS